MKKLILFLSICSTMALAQPMHKYSVTITNITKSQIFSPPAVIAHNPSYLLFNLGQPARPSLALMAEDGNNADLVAEAEMHDGVYGVASADGPVMPGQSVTLEVETPAGANWFTVVGMLVTTNDAFFALNAEQGPMAFYSRGNAMTYRAEAYDAGSEGNNEDCGFIPGPPCGSGGVRDTENAEGYVYLHSGIHGGMDIDSATYDWRSSVATISIKVMR